jgi:hypothetical protein
LHEFLLFIEEALGTTAPRVADLNDKSEYEAGEVFSAGDGAPSNISDLI